MRILAGRFWKSNTLYWNFGVFLIHCSYVSSLPDNSPIDSQDNTELAHLIEESNRKLKIIGGMAAKVGDVWLPPGLIKESKQSGPGYAGTVTTASPAGSPPPMSLFPPASTSVSTGSASSGSVSASLPPATVAATTSSSIQPATSGATVDKGSTVPSANPVSPQPNPPVPSQINASTLNFLLSLISNLIGTLIGLLRLG